MSQQFPKLQEEQVALLRADTNTGKILDKDFQYAINFNQNIYTIYASPIEGINAAKLIIEVRPDVECYIHNKDEELISFLDHTNYLEA